MKGHQVIYLMTVVARSLVKSETSTSQHDGTIHTVTTVLKASPSLVETAVDKLVQRQHSIHIHVYAIHISIFQFWYCT